MIKTTLKTLAAVLAIWGWCWAVFLKMPVLLTSGLAGSVAGITIFALLVIVPCILLGKFVGAKLKPKE